MMNSRTRPTVSVIIPAYHVTEYISEAINSVLQQTFTDFEIIVINDGCPDTVALENVLSSYRQRIVYEKKHNGGLASARNAGLRLARGSFVALLDGDDAWAPNYLEVQIGILQREPTTDVVYPNAVFFGKSPLAGRTIMEFSPSRGKVTFESLVSRKCCVTVSVTARAHIFDQAGGFDEGLRRAEDFDMWLRIAKIGGRITYHRQPLMRYRLRTDSLSADLLELRDAGLKVLDKAEATLHLSSSELAAVTLAKRHFRSDMYQFLAINALNRKDVAAGITAYRHMLSYRWSARIALRVMLLSLFPKLAMNFRQWRIRRRESADVVRSKRGRT